MYNIESIVSQLDSQVTEDSERQALLSALKARLAQLRQGEAELAAATLITLNTLTTKNSAEPAERGERSLQPEPLPTERQVSAPRSGSLPTGPDPSAHSNDAPDNAKNFAAALDKLDPALRQVAADLYEELHYKSKFARLTSRQREAIVQLLRIHTCERVVEIIAQPAPIGMNLQTSRQGVGRFREDYLQTAIQEQKRRAEEAAEQKRLAIEESFKKANTSDDAFRKVTETKSANASFRSPTIQPPTFTKFAGSSAASTCSNPTNHEIALQLHVASNENARILARPRVLECGDYSPPWISRPRSPHPPPLRLARRSRRRRNCQLPPPLLNSRHEFSPF